MIQPVHQVEILINMGENCFSSHKMPDRFRSRGNEAHVNLKTPVYGFQSLINFLKKTVFRRLSSWLTDEYADPL